MLMYFVHVHVRSTVTVHVLRTCTFVQVPCSYSCSIPLLVPVRVRVRARDHVRVHFRVHVRVHVPDFVLFLLAVFIL
jgi:hypothetical protein